MFSGFGTTKIPEIELMMANISRNMLLGFILVKKGILILYLLM
jgi:hypothetical protein